MKTKAEIVQKLLDENKITAEEAVTLLMGSKEKEYVYIPTYPAAPYPPFYVDPFPWRTTCGDTPGHISINGEGVLVSSQQDIDPEISKVVQKRFWDMI